MCLYIANLTTAGGHLGRDKTYEKICSLFVNEQMMLNLSLDNHFYNRMYPSSGAGV